MGFLYQLTLSGVLLTKYMNRNRLIGEGPLFGVIVLRRKDCPNHTINETLFYSTDYPAISYSQKK